MPQPAASPAILLVGGGNMGLARLDGWLEEGTPASSMAFFRASSSAALASLTGVLLTGQQRISSRRLSMGCFVTTY